MEAAVGTLPPNGTKPGLSEEDSFGTVVGVATDNVVGTEPNDAKDGKAAVFTTGAGGAAPKAGLELSLAVAEAAAGVPNAKEGLVVAEASLPGAEKVAPNPPKLPTDLTATSSFFFSSVAGTPGAPNETLLAAELLEELVLTPADGTPNTIGADDPAIAEEPPNIEAVDLGAPLVSSS